MEELEAFKVDQGLFRGITEVEVLLLYKRLHMLVGITSEAI